MNWKIPLFDPDLGAAELEAVQRPVRAGWLTMGEETQALEGELGERLGVEHVFGVSSGTAALHMACAALGFGPGDEVLCPSLTFVATANAIRYTGATPVFCEIRGEGDLNIDAEDARRRVTPRTKGIMVVHYGGFPCEMEAVLALAGERGLAVVEDCAHAMISRRGGRTCGTFGDAGCFSFFSNKNVTCGEGGAVVTNRADVADRLRLLRSHGMTTLTLDRHKGHAFTYDVLLHGYNYRIDEIRSALLRAQLDRLDGLLERRREHFLEYRRAFAGTEVRMPFADRADQADWPDTAVHILPVLLPEGTDRAVVMKAMGAAGIQTSVHYRPVHRMTAFEEGGFSLPLTESVAARELTLPLFPKMTGVDVRKVAETLLSVVSGRRSVVSGRQAMNDEPSRQDEGA